MIASVITSLVLLLGSTTFASQGNAQKRKTSSVPSANFFAESSSDIQKILSSKVFKNYTDYTIDNIRQGEIGEAQVYFVRLVKPFASNSEGMCFRFFGDTTMHGKPNPCDKVE